MHSLDTGAKLIKNSCYANKQTNYFTIISAMKK